MFFYEGRYMERVIADLMNLLDDDAAEWERNHLIDLILAPSDEHAVRSTFFTIAGVTAPLSSVWPYAPSPTMGRRCALCRKWWKGCSPVMASAGTMSSARLVCRYRGMLLGFVSFKRPPLKAIAISDADLAKCIAMAGPLVCGISQEVSLGEGDLAVRQAMAALRTAEREDAGIVRWTTLRFDAFRAAARSDRLYARAARPFALASVRLRC